MMENIGKTLLSGIIIVVVIAVGILLLPTFIQIALIAACIACGVLYFNSYPRWLERTGIDVLEDSPKSEHARNRAVENGYAEIREEYVISVKFREKILRDIEERQILTEEEFGKCCRASAPCFPIKYAGDILGCLAEEYDLLEVRWADMYLSKGLVDVCEQMLNKEGAATEIQFAALCSKSTRMRLYDDEKKEEIAETILDNMANNGRAEKMAHTESSGGPKGRYLYVSCEPSADCKMTRREISLD